MNHKNKNVVCLVIDRLRASALGAYGAAWCDTPHLDRLASESFLFDHALVNGPCLEATYRSYWQGAHALDSKADLAERSTLPAILGQGGFATTLLTDSSRVAEHPLAADFDACIRLDAVDDVPSAAELDETQFAQFCAAAVDYLDEIARNGGGPFFVWLHARGMAGPWDAPLEFRNRLADEEDPQPPAFTEVPCQVLEQDYDPDELLGIAQAYAGQVAALDECMGAFLHQFESRSLADSTLLVLTSPRGFPLGEHRRVGSGDEALYGETVHVPCLLRFPDGQGALLRSQALTEPSDLPLTLLAWLDSQETLPDADGHDLLPIIRGESDAIREAVCMIAGETERAIRTPGWHLRLASPEGTPELFVKPDDRWECNEIANRCAEVVRGLRAALAEFEQAVRAGKPAQFAPLDALLTTSPS